MIVPFTKPSQDGSVKYVKFFSGATHTNLNTLITEYNNVASTDDADAIEVLYSVPTIGMASVNITYGNSTVYLSETINVDTTSTTTFWTDINGWLLANNFYDIILVAGSPNKYQVTNLSNNTYILLFT